MITTAYLCAVGKVKKVADTSNSQEMTSVKLDLIGTSITILVPRSLCFDQRGVKTIKDGAECYIKAELANDNNVKSFDGNYRASLSYRIEKIVEFRIATKEDEKLAV